MFVVRGCVVLTLAGVAIGALLADAFGLPAAPCGPSQL
jgi:hypothetical protein